MDPFLKFLSDKLENKMISSCINAGKRIISYIMPAWPYAYNFTGTCTCSYILAVFRFTPHDQNLPALFLKCWHFRLALAVFWSYLSHSMLYISHSRNSVMYILTDLPYSSHISILHNYPYTLCIFPILVRRANNTNFSPECSHCQKKLGHLRHLHLLEPGLRMSSGQGI